MLQLLNDNRLKNKPGRYGIKVWDVETSYLFYIQPYTGKMDGIRKLNQGERPVAELISAFWGSGRGVTVNNFYVSSTSQELTPYKITLTGTIQSNKRDVPR